MAEKKVEKTEEKLEDALLKVALGYQLAEVTEEYAEVNGELKLTKRKKTKKDVPPDLKAVQLLLSGGNEEEIVKLTDEELEKEKERLMASLQVAWEQAREEAQTVLPATQKRTAAKKKPAAKGTARRSVRKKTVKKGE